MTLDQESSRAKGDLDVALLLRIMQRLGEFRSEYGVYLTTDDFFDAVPEEIQDAGGLKPALYLHAHLDFLQGRHLVRLGQPALATLIRTIQLTTEGQMFVQPELAEFGPRPMLPQVVNYIVNKIEVSERPNEEKAGMIFKLREAIASQGTDLIAKVLVEVGSKILES